MKSLLLSLEPSRPSFFSLAGFEANCCYLIHWVGCTVIQLTEVQHTSCASLVAFLGDGNNNSLGEILNAYVCPPPLGQVYTWGCNDEGVLGRAAEEGEEYAPGLVEKLGQANIVQVSAGDSHTAALAANGNVYCWGVFRVRLDWLSPRVVQ